MRTSFRDLLGHKKPPIGTLLSLPSPEIAEVAAASGFDWLFLDMEHGLLDFVETQRMIQAVAGRCPCLVRVPTNDGPLISKSLDTGADGIIFPHVNSAAEAGACVRAAKYPPQGSRSIGIARAQGYGQRLAADIAKANATIFLTAQAEHIDAARAIDDILAVPGIDAVFIGPYDLSASLGIPGQVGAGPVTDAIESIRSAAMRRGIPAGIFAGTAEAAKEDIRQGFDFICVATDTLLLADASRRLLDTLR